MTATFAEQVHPSLVASVEHRIAQLRGDVGARRARGDATPSTLYLKWSYLTQMLHLSKPWLAIPLSSLSQSGGVNLGQILSQATGSGPLAQSQLLAGGDVRAPGGHRKPRRRSRHRVHRDAPARQGARLPFRQRPRRSCSRRWRSAGFTEETFTVWIDGQHTVRKAVDTETGKDVTETITTTITSINQPVNIAVPRGQPDVTAARRRPERPQLARGTLSAEPLKAAWPAPAEAGPGGRSGR